MWAKEVEEVVGTTAAVYLVVVEALVVDRLVFQAGSWVWAKEVEEVVAEALVVDRLVFWAGSWVWEKEVEGEVGMMETVYSVVAGSWVLAKEVEEVES